MDFAKARENMVACQLMTGGITNQSVLDVFSRVPRELFLPEDKRGVAYLDDDLPVNDNGGFILEPLVHARMLQALSLSPDDVVLNCGDVTGYSSAILSSLVSTVVTLEPQQGLLNNARKVWEDLDFCNIAVIEGDTLIGNAEHAPYNAIFINGAVPAEPRDLAEQLADCGRVVSVVVSPGQVAGQVVLMERQSEGCIASSNLCDAMTSYVAEMNPKEGFVL